MTKDNELYKLKKVFEALTLEMQQGQEEMRKGEKYMKKSTLKRTQRKAQEELKQSIDQQQAVPKDDVKQEFKYVKQELQEDKSVLVMRLMNVLEP